MLSWICCALFTSHGTRQFVNRVNGILTFSLPTPEISQSLDAGVGVLEYDVTVNFVGLPGALPT